MIICFIVISSFAPVKRSVIRLVDRRINELNINRVYNIFYGLDEQRIKTMYDDFSISGNIKTRYLFGTYEKDIDEFGNIYCSIFHISVTSNVILS